VKNPSETSPTAPRQNCHVLVDSEIVSATDLGGGQYRLEEGLVFTDIAARGDIVEAVRVQGEVHPEFLCVVERGPFRVSETCLVPVEFIDSAAFKSFSDELLAAGGDWEVVFGGFLRFYVPKGCDFVLGPRWRALWGEGEEPAFEEGCLDEDPGREEWR
jgi:hypothetical protein